MLTLVTSAKNSGYSCEQKSNFKCALLFYEYLLHLNIYFHTQNSIFQYKNILYFFFVKQQQNKLNF